MGMVPGLEASGWRPRRGIQEDEVMRDIKKIIVHCSDSTFGDARAIDRWHRERGWECVGYHWILCNGHRTSMSEYSTEVDGLIEPGRPARMVGAHCKGHNADSIGICLIGEKEV